jgi:hypothetical protein
MSGKGTTISRAADATSQRKRPRRGASAPDRQASPTSTAAPRTTRTQARNAGGIPSSTATLMNR